VSFYAKTIGSAVIFRSSLLDNCSVKHAFSTRHGGVSTIAHTASMNVAFGRGDDGATVIRNTEILLSAAEIVPANVISVPQIHSADILTVAKNSPSLNEFRGSGVHKPASLQLDGYVTNSPDLAPMVKVADCVPVLMCDPVHRIVAAIHSGWKGTAHSIAVRGVEAMENLGASRKYIVAAIGASIRACCYEVGEDFYEEFERIRGAEFARKYITPRVNESSGEQKYSADIAAMIVSDLISAGISAQNIDISADCTCCDPATFHSHRASGGVRGTMGAVISL
jgi:uncharacterized protein, YfiH family